MHDKVQVISMVTSISWNRSTIPYTQSNNTKQTHQNLSNLPLHIQSHISRDSIILNVTIHPPHCFRSSIMWCAGCILPVHVFQHLRSHNNTTTILLHRAGGIIGTLQQWYHSKQSVLVLYNIFYVSSSSQIMCIYIYRFTFIEVVWSAERVD